MQKMKKSASAIPQVRLVQMWYVHRALIGSTPICVLFLELLRHCPASIFCLHFY